MSERYAKLLKTIKDGSVILIDGATGTEIEKRGVPQLEDAWNGGGALSHPDIVREVHEDYLRCGAKIIISNTFATHRSALEDAGVDDRFEDYNRRGLELALEARANLKMDDVLVAGGLSYWSWSGNKPTIERLHQNAIEQAAIYAEGGADLIMLEMMIDIDRMQACLDASLATGLPVWAGLTCKIDDDGKVCLRNGEPLIDAIAELTQRDIPVVNVMHTDIAIVDDCLEALRANYEGIIGVYAHSGKFEGHHMQFDSVCSPDDYQRHVKQWLRHDVRVVGGCCGIGPEHMRQLATAI